MSIYNNLVRFVKSNAPVILTGMGAAGVVGTAILAAKGGQKANQHLSELPADLTRVEKFKETWRFYVPAGISAVGAISCVVGAQTLNTRRQAVLMGLYSMAETQLVEHQDKITELLGEKRAKEVSNAIAADQVEANPPSKEFILADPEEQMFLEGMSGRYFNSSVEHLRQAAIDMNEEIVRCDYVLLNDWYDRIGLDKVQMGDEQGWNHSKMIELEFSAIPFKSPEGITRPIMVVKYRNNPLPTPYNPF